MHKRLLALPLLLLALFALWPAAAQSVPGGPLVLWIAGDLYAADPGTPTLPPRPLTQMGVISGPTLSPAGNWVAFKAAAPVGLAALDRIQTDGLIAAYDLPADLYLLDPRSGSLALVASQPANASLLAEGVPDNATVRSAPSWSPDGTRLAWMEFPFGAAEARLSDGQVLRAVNDLFIGPRTHTSAQYELSFDGRREWQSSSGLIVSTGLGSTAWLRSVVTGSLAIAAAWGHQTATTQAYTPLPWDAGQLVFAVREPFPSRRSQVGLVCGQVDAKHPLEIRSGMPEHGVIFSDGIEADFLRFNAGVSARIGVAATQGCLISSG